MILLQIPTTLFDAALAPGFMAVAMAASAYYLFWQMRWV